MPSSHDVTEVLRELSDGRESAPERLLPLVYDELRKLAHGGNPPRRKISPLILFSQDSFAKNNDAHH